MNKPDKNGARPFPNNIEHLIPEFLTVFDFPDIVAALAPRPVICTEGGMDRDFKIISKAFDIAGAPRRLSIITMPSTPTLLIANIWMNCPTGLTVPSFSVLQMLTLPTTISKLEWVMPWLQKLLAEDAK